MGQAPSTVMQLVFTVLLVLPGVTYQFLRERWRGPAPGERELGQRVLRALTASILLDAAYAIIAGPQLVKLVRGSTPNGWNGFVEQPRQVAGVALVLFILVPALAAAVVSVLQRRKAGARFTLVPTAWDFTFRNRGACFVRARLKDGAWVGGWYGNASYAASYPSDGELFLQSAWHLAADGTFLRRVDNSAGLYLRADNVDFLELVEPAPTPPVNSAKEQT